MSTSTAQPPGVTPTVQPSLAPKRLTDTIASLSENARGKMAGIANAVDPSKVDWSSLHTHLPTLPPMNSTAIIVSAICVVVFLIIFVYYIVQLYRWNVRECPVLLSDPIRGANITTMPSRLALPMYPVIDREYTKYKGIRLPYRANDIMFLDTPEPLPEINYSMEFTLNFWLRIENFQYNNPNDANALETFPVLFVQDPTTEQFRVLYDATNNTMVITVNIRSKKGTANGQQTRRVEVFRVPNILLIQEWQMITIVLDNRDLDVYQNGRLYRSFYLANVPELINNDWRLFPGKVPFLGMISCARYFHYAFNTHEAARLYRWLDGKPIPREAYFLWWSWYRGNSFTALFDNFQKKQVGET